MLVDIIFVAILGISLLVGYHRGFLKELYDLIGVSVITLISYLLRNSIPFDLNFESTTNQLIFNNLKPVLTFVIIFALLITIFEIVVAILIKKGKLKDTLGELDHYGAIFSGIMAIVVLMLYSFAIGLTPLINKGQVFTNSKITEDFLKLNKPLYTLRNNIIKIKEDAERLNEIITDKEDIDKEEIDKIADDISKNPVVTDKVIKDTVKVIVEKPSTPPKTSVDSIIDKTLSLVRNGTPVTITQAEKDDLFAEIKAHPQFAIAKAMYEKDVLDEALIMDILADNGVSGFTEADITQLFEGE